jgi:hypothetical protein
MEPLRSTKDFRGALVAPFSFAAHGPQHLPQPGWQQLAAVPEAQFEAALAGQVF